LLLLRAGKRTAHLQAIVALVLAVWVIYTADRLLDGLAPRSGSFLRTRHSFCARHRFVLTSLLLIFGAALIWIGMEGLEATTVRGGLILGVIVVLYLASIHAGPARFSRLLPKEIAVGMIFAAGTTVPLLSKPGRFPPQSHYWVLAALMFGLLCSLNCLSIECWERPSSIREQHKTGLPWIAWADAHLGAIALGVATAALLAGFLSACGGAMEIPFFAISSAALLTAMLNGQRRKLSPEALRVLADAALVLPALAALLLFH
jgi:hypothetical protein